MLVLTGRWTGLKDAIRNAEALGRDIANDEVIGKALLRTAEPLRDDIAAAAPRSKVAPHVAETFVAKMSRDESRGRMTVVVGPKPGYPGLVAPFLEFGTSKMAPRPFIRPTYDGWRATSWPGALVDQIRTQYERVVRKYVQRALKAAR